MGRNSSKVVHNSIDGIQNDDNVALSYKDVIVVASVSCIYGIGEVEEYKNKILTLAVGEAVERNKVLEKLVDMLYERNDYDFKRGTFRVRGDVLEIIPSNERTTAIRVEFFGDEIDKICEIDTITGAIIKSKKTTTIFPASHFVTSPEKLKIAIQNIRKELEERQEYFKKNNKLIKISMI